MLLSNGNSHNALANINPPAFFSALESFTPSSKVAALTTGLALLDGGTKRRFVYFGIASIDFQFLHSRSLF